MNVLLTGATGFTGKYVVRELLEKGHRVCCVVRDRERLLKSLNGSQPEVLTVEEINQPENLSIAEWKRIFKEKNIDSIVHSAALAREYSLPWSEYEKVNIEWTRKLALSFSELDIDHGKFVYISTVGVYGTIPQACPANESTPYHPDGKYHTSKMLTEEVLLEIKNSTGLPLTILRPSIMYGEGDYGFLYKLFRLTATRVFPIPAGNHQIHLLDAGSFARAIESALNNSNGNGNCIYNISDNGPVPIADLLECIKGYTPGGYIKTPSILFSLLEYISRINPAINIKVRLASKNWYYDVAKIQNDLGLSLNDTYTNLEKYAAWYMGESNGNS